MGHAPIYLMPLVPLRYDPAILETQVAALVVSEKHDVACAQVASVLMGVALYVLVDCNSPVAIWSFGCEGYDQFVQYARFQTLRIYTLFDRGHFVP